MLRDTLNFHSASLKRPRRIVNSLDHVAWGNAHANLVLGWFARLPRRNADSSLVLEVDDLAARCRAVFDAEPLIVNLSNPDLAPSITVMRVLQPHAHRKEWTHKRAFWGGKRLTNKSGDQP